MRALFGCCVGSWDKFRAYVIPAVGDDPVITLAGQRSIAVAYNSILRAWRYAYGNYPLVLLHDDLEIADPHGVEKLLEPMRDPGVGLVGVAGGGTGCGLAWWGDNPIGHQQIDTGLIDFGVRSGEVAHVEGSVMALSPQLPGGVRFDESYRGFHGYDEIGTVVRATGKRVVVVDADTYHHTVTGFSSPESEALWHEADGRFLSKWGAR